MEKRTSKRPFIEPFDQATMQYYGAEPDWTAYRRAVECAAAAGDDRAKYAMATWFLHGMPALGLRKNPRRGLPLLTEAARSFHLAMFDLAYAYEAGKLGLARNQATAVRWYRRSMRFGNVQARFEVGRCLAHGLGVRVNAREAERLRTEAETMGYAGR